MVREPYENVNILEYDNSGRGGKYYDWDKAYFRTAIYQTYDMSVSGATQNTNYYTSLSYTQDEGRLKMNSLRPCFRSPEPHPEGGEIP